MKKKRGLFKGVNFLPVLDTNMVVQSAVHHLVGFKSLTNTEGWESGFSEIPEEKALRAEFMELVVTGSF